MSSRDVLEKLAERIESSICSSEVFSTESSVRAIVRNSFLENYKNNYGIKGDMISDKVAERMQGNLTEQQTDKLHRINTAWHEWEYILEEFGNPTVPDKFKI